MRIIDTTLPGCKLITPSPIEDERGSFTRIFDAEIMAAHGMATALAQASLSVNRVKGTLRGLHFQAHPHMEDKIVRCARGAIFDVAVDLRLGSQTFGKWYATELSEGTGEQLYIPAGFAHGFQTLTPGAVVAYHISVPFDPALGCGLRYDDPSVGIAWPLPPVLLSDRDLALPYLGQLDQSQLLPLRAGRSEP